METDLENVDDLLRSLAPITLFELFSLNPVNFVLSASSIIFPTVQCLDFLAYPSNLRDALQILFA
jgi:hypothetical protein